MRDQLFDPKRVNGPKWHKEHVEMNQQQRDAITSLQPLVIKMAYSGVMEVVTATHLYLINRHGKTTFYSRRRQSR